MREEIGFICEPALGFFPRAFLFSIALTNLSSEEAIQKRRYQMTSQVADQTQKPSTDPNSKTKMNTVYLIKVALFSAIAFIVMYAEFPIGTLFPPYLKVDLSEVIVFIGGMVLGPAAVIFMELIKNLLNFMLKSSTGGVGGELANFTVGLALILPTVLLLRKKGFNC